MWLRRLVQGAAGVHDLSALVLILVLERSVMLIFQA